MDVAAFERVHECFREFHGFFAAAFGRKQWREHSRHYPQALLVQSQERRNAENLSETVPASARAMQRFLTEGRWDDDAIIGRLQEYLGSPLEHPQAVWVFDGSDFPKQGVKSVGVARQYCGALGRSPTVRPGCFWLMWDHAGGLWWTSACICPKSGLRTLGAARRLECRKIIGSTGQRRSWPWRCWNGHGSGAT